MPAMSIISTRPPGFSTRRTSASAACMSCQWCALIRLTTQSNVAVSNGSRSAGPCCVRTFASPRSRAAASTVASIGAARSYATTSRTCGATAKLA